MNSRQCETGISALPISSGAMLTVGYSKSPGATAEPFASDTVSATSVADTAALDTTPQPTGSMSTVIRCLDAHQKRVGDRSIGAAGCFLKNPK